MSGRGRHALPRPPEVIVWVVPVFENLPFGQGEKGRTQGVTNRVVRPEPSLLFKERVGAKEAQRPSEFVLSNVGIGPVGERVGERHAPDPLPRVHYAAIRAH